jgi:hypothetical protein
MKEAVLGHVGASSTRPYLNFDAKQTMCLGRDQGHSVVNMALGCRGGKAEARQCVGIFMRSGTLAGE